MKKSEGSDQNHKANSSDLIFRTERQPKSQQHFAEFKFKRHSLNTEETSEKFEFGHSLNGRLQRRNYTENELLVLPPLARILILHCFCAHSTFDVSFFSFLLSSLKPDDYLRLVDRGGACVCVWVCTTMACAEHTKQENEKNRNLRQWAYTYVWMWGNIVLSKRHASLSQTQAREPFLVVWKLFSFVQYCVSRCTLRTWVIRFIFINEIAFHVI